LWKGTDARCYHDYVEGKADTGVHLDENGVYHWQDRTLTSALEAIGGVNWPRMKSVATKVKSIRIDGLGKGILAKAGTRVSWHKNSMD
jgi:hypothetical protein